MSYVKGAVVALVCGTGAAQAATFDALATVSDISGRTVNLWFEEQFATGLTYDFVIGDPGTMVINDDGTASLDAVAASEVDAASGFSFTMAFDQNFAAAPQFKSFFGVPDPGNIEFFNLASGVLTGFGGLEGLDLAIVAFPDEGGAATQVGGGLPTGGGANQHNENFGMSAWFSISEILSMDCDLCDDDDAIAGLVGSQGDIVVDLVPSAVPVPASFGLLLTALAGFAAFRRKS